MGRGTTRPGEIVGESRVKLRSAIFLRRGALSKKSSSFVMKTRLEPREVPRLNSNTVRFDRFLHGRSVATPYRLNLRNGERCLGKIELGMATPLSELSRGWIISTSLRSRAENGRLLRRSESVSDEETEMVKESDLLRDGVATERAWLQYEVS